MATYFNAEALEEIISLDDKSGNSLLASIVADYTSSFETFIKDIKSAVKNMDVKALQNVSHSLKSSSKLLGLEVIGDVCAKIEEDARDGRISSPEVIDELTSASKPSLDAMQDYVKTLTRTLQ